MADLSEERDPLEELAEEFLARRRRGEAPDVAEYLARAPGRADELRDLLAALSLVEDLRPSQDETCSTRGDANSRGPAPLPERMGDYLIVREVGRGGMGVVYEAEQKSLRRRVALKVLAPWARADPQLVQRFLREARSAARLHHPNIVPIYDVGEDDGQHFYAMQFIPGLGLDQVLAEVRHVLGRLGDGPMQGDDAATQVGTEHDVPSSGTTPLLGGEGRRPGVSASPLRGISTTLSGDDPVAGYHETAARLGACVAEAIQYAHEQGMLHRDIKPSNLLLDERGEIWVTDFGLVKAADGDDLTATGDLVGTLRYMAPERFRGHCDARSDVYALGLTLYELFALRPAFPASDRHWLIHQITQGGPPPLRRLVPGLPRDLATIVHTAIAREPAERYPTAGQLADDLRRWLRHEPIRARPAAPHERLAKWARRNPIVAALAGVTALAVVAALTSLAIGYARVSEALRQQEQVTYFQRIALAERAWSGHDVGRAELLLDQTPEALRGWEWRYLKRLCHSERLTIQADAAVRPNAQAFSPDGRVLATAAPDGRIALHAVASGRVVRTMPGHQRGVHSLAFRRDGAVLASAGGDGALRLWDVATGRLLAESEPTAGREALSASFNADGTILATGSGSYWEIPGVASGKGALTLHDAQTGRALRVLEGHAGSVHRVAFAPQGDRIASAGGDGTVRIWDGRSGEPLLTLRGHEGAVMAVAYRPDGRHLASAGLDGSLRVWDAATGAPLLTIREPGERFLGVTFSPDGHHLAAAGRSWAVTTWDAATGARLEIYRGHGREVLDVAYSPDGRLLASAGFDGAVRLWDARRGQRASVLPGFSAMPSAVALDPSGRRLATVDGSGPASIRTPPTAPPTLVPADAAARHTSAAFSPDGAILATASRDSGVVELRHAATGALRAALPCDAAGVTALAFAPDGRTVAAGGRDGVVRTWEVASGRPGRTYGGAPGPITGLAFVAGGASLVGSTGNPDHIRTPGVVVAWDVPTGRVTRVLHGHDRGISDLAAAPGGRTFATAGWDGSVRLWDATTGAPVHTLEIRGLLVWAVAFTPDGRRVVAADNIGRVTFWDVASGMEVLTLRAHEDRIYDLAFSADGRLLATISRDATARVWDATPLPGAAASP